MLTITTLVTLLAGVTNALPATNNVFESLPGIPQGWRRVGTPERDAVLTFKIAMSARDPEAFEESLYTMSDPEHPSYGQHLMRDTLKDMLRPTEEASNAITAWLTDRGVDSRAINDDGEWITFRTTVEKAEDLLETKFHAYKHPHASMEKIRTLSYSIPRSLHSYVDMIQPTTRFSQIKPQLSHVLDSKVIGKIGTVSRVAGLSLNATLCNSTITPACLRGLYNIPVDNGLKNTSAGFAAFNNFLEEVPRYADLSAFETSLAPYAVGKSFKFVSIDGGTTDQTSTDDSIEANLDAEYITSIGYPVPITAYSTSGRAPLVPDLDQPDVTMSSNEPYMDFLTYILAQPDSALPHTISTSYGEDEQSVPLSYRLKVCQMFGQLGARGVSVIFSSGDTGVGSACQTNDGKNTTRFLPTFPAACPYVTSVGGTHYVEPEQAIYFSSGGFSDTWSRPQYQDRAVTKYLSILGDKWKGLYNPSGRGIPDVAAQGSRFVVIDKGLTILVGGTSASSPTFAGVVAVLNGLRIQSGKPGLGFLNPWIYSKAYKGLNDITEGGSRGCTGKDIYSGLPTPIVPYASWNATPGWDPVTGYGTPDFAKLKPLALGR